MNRLEQLKTIPGEQISFFGEKGKTAKTKNTLSYPSLFFERVTDIIWGPQLAVEDKGKEQQRLFYREGEVVQVRKMVLDSQEPEIYLKMLLDDIAHFTGVMEKTENGEFRPPTIEEFKKKA